MRAVASLIGSVFEGDAGAPGAAAGSFVAGVGVVGSAARAVAVNTN
jgi:hypothetical protein